MKPGQLEFACEVNMWIVTCDYVRGVLTYYVENRETGERRGEFDCELWAERFADQLNLEMAR